RSSASTPTFCAFDQTLSALIYARTPRITCRLALPSANSSRTIATNGQIRRNTRQRAGTDTGGMKLCMTSPRADAPPVRRGPSGFPSKQAAGQSSRRKRRGPGICFGRPSAAYPHPISHASLRDDRPYCRSDERKERRMTQCRMCSQRLTGPGKLCRDCEREIERARMAGVSVDEWSAVPLIDASRVAPTEEGAGRLGRRHSRGSMIAAAFTVGLIGAMAFDIALRSDAAAVPGSVMLDRDISGLHARSFMPSSALTSELAGTTASSNGGAGIAERTEQRTQTSSGDDLS